MYVVLSQGASKLPEVKDLDSCTLIPLEIKQHKVPHLKGLNSGIKP